ncbi:hypothetical protein, partial [Eudoraea sp.]|uniref:hypothetical protein n=1 Tax=Eudoraea sp. TaxID=1979955 RepID=UPI003C7714E8
MNFNNYLIKKQPSATAFPNKKLEIVNASDQWINSFCSTDRKIKIIGITIFLLVQYNVFGQAAASQNYVTQAGTLGTTYDWIDCSGGTTILDSGDDVQTDVSWPFNFSYYDNNYTTSNNLSVASNGFIRLDGVADGDNWTGARDYILNANATQLGQIIALAMYDGNLNQSSDGTWIRSLVTGSAPQRIFTIEYNQLEIDYNDNKYTDVQVSFYESTNRIVLKLRDEDLSKNDVDMGLHSGVSGYFDYWQEVKDGSIGWIEYTPLNIEVSDLNNIAYFPTLKDAFDKHNDGTFGGEVDVKINSSTSEYASPILKSSGTGSSNYASVNIYPTKSGLSITGNLAGPFIDLKGADNVTFDGRVNATGSAKDLSIVNLSTSNARNTSTIRFINAATNNTVRFCTIKGAPSENKSAILLFRTSNSSSGNNNNLIDNNDITSLSALNDRPDNVIYSLGTNGKKNRNNTVSNNNIYDFFRPNNTSYGIHLNKNSEDWIIDGNSFYETASFIASGTFTYEVIRVRNNNNNGIQIKNNFIGGSAPLCIGEWNKAGGTNNVFRAIYTFAGSTTPTAIENNTIKNFDWDNSGSAEWGAIKVQTGDVNILGNTIGETTGTGSIKVTGGTNTQSVYGIRIANTGVVNCSNNKIGSISALVSTTNSTNLYAIHLSGDFVGEIKNN